jgi:hypothetical protein
MLDPIKLHQLLHCEMDYGDAVCQFAMANFGKPNSPQ